MCNSNSNSNMLSRDFNVWILNRGNMKAQSKLINKNKQIKVNDTTASSNTVWYNSYTNTHTHTLLLN
jgi:nicotinamide riboside kinase